MASREIELARPLLDEVVEWIQAGTIFSGFNQAISASAYKFADGEIPVRIVGISEWFLDVDIKNEDSRYIDLIDLTKDIESAFRLIHQFGPHDFEDYSFQQYEIIQKTVIEDQVVESFARRLHDLDSMKNASCEESIEQLRSTVLSHYNGIVRSRAASLSKRHAPMEALFYAYQQGLFPFGWDWESIICLDPNNLEN